MTEHATGTREEWLTARRALLEREKELSRLGDELARERQALPWVRVEKEYRIDTVDGPRTLAELFDGRSQLITYHFMFGPDWEEGCAGCTFCADHLEGAIPHLPEHGVTMVSVSRAPLAKLEAFKRKKGWTFPWVSSYGSDFNYDFGVSFTDEQRAHGAEYNFRWLEPATERPGSLVLMDELHGLSAFALEDGVVYHTYSTYARGTDVLLGTFQLLDRAPLGRAGA